MKRSYLFLLLGLAIAILVFVEKKAGAMEITYDEAVESYNEYKTEVKSFEENPDEDKILKLTKRGRELTKTYDAIIEHQTFGNNLFNVKPILNEQEIKHLKELNSNLEQYYGKIDEAVLKEKYSAKDLAPLIKIAEKEGEYHSGGIDITFEPVGFYEISIDGTFRDEHSSIISRKYFIFETNQGNFYWRKPSGNRMISYGENEATVRFDQKQYTIKGNIIHKGFEGIGD
ncbi:hypothetical protein [Pontibacillus marinus]|uniref:Uncharacterized protein n=1 Tax=Pontibacillus marinus BH030004 = DSM 16465 TaxID=1385511 RepID=A0A0A5GL59_9BACI|nr:hypothetical protein [Pontibacillus marinus]KGX91900.1 hypothetical protein N783_00865 [Pontibacillus marinus BH030004 = DSM 16465]